MKRPGKPIKLLLGLLMLICVTGALVTLCWPHKERAREGIGSLSKDNPPSVETGVESYVERMPTPEEIFQNFAKSITNAATIDQWHAWALKTLASKRTGSVVEGNIALRKTDLPSFVPRPEGLAEAHIAHSDKTNAHLDICWRGNDFFYGILVSTDSFHWPENRPGRVAKVIELGSGLYAYLEM